MMVVNLIELCNLQPPRLPAIMHISCSAHINFHTHNMHRFHYRNLLRVFITFYYYQPIVILLNICKEMICGPVYGQKKYYYFDSVLATG